MEIELRRCQNTLIIIGTGVITFGFWSVIKATAAFAMEYKSTRADLYSIWEGMQLDAEAQKILTPQVIYTMYYSIIALFYLFIILLRLYIGLSAAAEGKGKKRGNAYLIMAGCIMVVELLTDLVAIWHFDYHDFMSIDDVISKIVSFIVEMTSLITLWEMISAGIHVKALKKKLG